jgi:hemoglobin-like flavoprotein
VNFNLVDAAKLVAADLVLMSVTGAASDSPMELGRMKYAEKYLRASGLRFYEQLFALDPTVAHLFAHVDIDHQERKLMIMMTEIVRVLDQPVELVPELASLGHRHVGYGVKDDDYGSIGSALLWLLEQVLGEEFTPELREAWSEAYLLVSSIMRRGAARAGAGSV